MSIRPTIYNIAGDVQTSGTTTQSLVLFETSNDQSYAVFAEVTGINRADAEGGAYFLKAGFKNMGGTLTQIGSTITDAFENDPDWDVFFTVVTNRINLNAQGGAGDTVDWTCSMRIIVSQG